MTAPPSDHDPTFVDLLELEEIDRDIFRGCTHAGAPMRTFGGQVAAQALVAAGRTAGDRSVHSLHSYFLRPGRPISTSLAVRNFFQSKALSILDQP